MRVILETNFNLCAVLLEINPYISHRRDSQGSHDAWQGSNYRGWADHLSVINLRSTNILNHTDTVSCCRNRSNISNYWLFTPTIKISFGLGSFVYYLLNLCLYICSSICDVSGYFLRFLFSFCLNSSFFNRPCISCFINRLIGCI